MGRWFCLSVLSLVLFDGKGLLLTRIELSDLPADGQRAIARSQFSTHLLNIVKAKSPARDRGILTNLGEASLKKARRVAVSLSPLHHCSQCQ
jgi:hypothetical protein